MLSTLLLATSLWSASQEPRPVPASAFVTPEKDVGEDLDKFGDDLWWTITSHAGDLFTTAIALERCNGKCGEANPAGFNAEARMAIKVAGTTASAATMWKLRRAKKNREATIVRWITVGINSALMVNNGWHAWKKR